MNYERGKEVLKDLFGFSPYRYPKPVGLLKKIIDVSTNSDDVIMDFFAGSGTTAHAVLKLNREGNGERKFILVDMAEYFDTVLVPRIKKVAFSFNWKDGKPEDIGGSGGFFKYHYFEQYEDALENIRFEQKTLPEFEDYFIKYVLDFETKQSSTFLNIDEMADPFNYKLRVIENYEPRTVNVDMVETFNYLFGFNVAKMCTFNDGQRLYYVLFGKHNNRNTVIIWRNTKDLNLTRDKKFIEEKVLSGHSYDFIFVNGDSYVKNARAIEPEFKKLMVA